MESLLNVMVLLLSKTRLIFRWKNEIPLHARQQFLGKETILLACFHVSCFLLCSVSKVGLLSYIASPQLARCCSCQCSVSPDRAVDFHSMQTSPVMCSVKWLQEFAGCCHAPVTLVKNACVLCALVQLLSKVQQPPMYAKEPKCSCEPVSDFALKWIKIMHKIQSVSVTGLVMSRTGGTLGYSFLLELCGMFEELGNWGRENYNE